LPICCTICRICKNKGETINHFEHLSKVEHLFHTHSSILFGQVRVHRTYKAWHG
jgi:hypothetical protein